MHVKPKSILCKICVKYRTINQIRKISTGKMEKKSGVRNILVLSNSAAKWMKIKNSFYFIQYII